jgi:DNA replication protein DnaC
MLAVALARAAVEAGQRAYYTTAADLAARCHRAAIEGRWATTMRFFAGPKLLVIDEVGYLPLPAEAAAALFQVVSHRYGRGSIALTTNLGIASWGRIFDDSTVAAAMLGMSGKVLELAPHDGPVVSASPRGDGWNAPRS